MQGMPAPIAALIEELSKLPTIGPKTASRLAFFILRNSTDQARSLAEAIIQVKEKIGYCSVCYNLTDTDPCAICTNPQRNAAQICVVAEPLDVLAIERTGMYKGLYHVLHGKLNPLEGIGPNQIKIRELLERLRRGEVTEMILATNPNYEGDYTATYIKEQAIGTGVDVTSLARGLPIGGDLEYADEVTLARALEGRQKL